MRAWTPYARQDVKAGGATVTDEIDAEEESIKITGEQNMRHSSKGKKIRYNQRDEISISTKMKVYEAPNYNRREPNDIHGGTNNSLTAADTTTITGKASSYKPGS